MARSRHTPAARGGKWIRASTRWAIYHRDSFACVYCFKVGGKLTLDHVDPVVLQGRMNLPSHLVTCCHSCNSRKSGKTLEEFAGSDYVALRILVRLACEKAARSEAWSFSRPALFSEPRASKERRRFSKLASM